MSDPLRTTILDLVLDDHPALRRVETVNHTVCGDQIPESVPLWIYEWPQFAVFLAATVGKETLYAMRDPLARVNVMAYREGEALNWHFDRSEFTTTLLLQAPEAGGDSRARLLRRVRRAVTPVPGRIRVALQLGRRG